MNALSRSRFFRRACPAIVRFGVAALSLMIVTWQAITLGTTQEPAKHHPQAPIDFREPSREYVEKRAGDLKVSVERELQTDSPEVADRAIARLKANRDKALKLMPAAARERLSKLRFFLMEGPKSKNGGRDNGLEYFQRTAAEHHRKLDPRWNDTIVIYCAQNYLDLTELWAMKALFHELAHAYQLEVWPENQPDIVSAYDHAKEAGLYQNVIDVEARHEIQRAYAMVNQLEYFAELSAMYFVGCNYHPTDRDELKTYDPVGYEMVKKLWRVDVP